MLFDQNHNTSKIDDGLETAKQLIVSRCHTAKVFYLVEETLNQSMDFGGLSSTGNANILIPVGIYSPFLAPPAC